MFALFFCEPNTAYDMRISDWSSDVCSSDLGSHWNPVLPFNDGELFHRRGGGKHRRAEAVPTLYLPRSWRHARPADAREGSRICRSGPGDRRDRKSVV